MNPQQAFGFLAHCLVTGKANWTEEDKRLLNRMASRYIGKEMRVSSRVEHPDSGGQEFAGIVLEQNEETVTVQLDEPIEITGSGGISAMTSEITVSIDAVRLDTPETEPPVVEPPAAA